MGTAPDNNLERMIQLAEDFFAAKSDPSQISVTPGVMRRLKKIHPATITERRTAGGPVAWILILPTTKILMEQFISKKINERELYKKTPIHKKYDSIYLCSALVLPEHRGRGLAKKMMIKAITSVQKDHPVQALFYWAFSAKGKKLALSVSRELSIPLFRRL